MHSFAGIENVDGRLGLGIINVWYCMGRAIELAREHGIGLVALRNTNHWFRAATYGCQACDADMAGICFTNTIPNRPTWGAVDSRIGNNPLVCIVYSGQKAAETRAENLVKGIPVDEKIWETILKL